LHLRRLPGEGEDEPEEPLLLHPGIREGPVGEVIHLRRWQIERCTAKLVDMRYLCDVCKVFEYDDARGYSPSNIHPGTDPKDFPEDWECPICASDSTHLQPMVEERIEEVTFLCPHCGKTSSMVTKVEGGESELYLGEWRRGSDDLEVHMADIHSMADTNEYIMEPMRTTLPVISWDDILIKGAQLARIPLNDEVEVNTRTVIGPRTMKPMVIDTPILVTHMSFGALSREVKLAIAKGTAMVGTAMGSGEGGILEDALASSHRYIFEYVPNRYSVTEENLRRVDAIEIKVGQSTKPGMGAHLPAEKVTAEIARIRGTNEGSDVISPASFEDIRSPEDLRAKLDWLRRRSEGRPIGIKLAAGNIEEDLAVALQARPDFVTIDGRPGATAASPKFIKQATSMPTIFALHRARKFLDEMGADDVSLIITGGLRVSKDFAKALAMGADAVAIGTAALMACACQQYRLCDTGKCPVGVTTQDEGPRSRLWPDISAKRLANFLNVSTRELRDFARLTGNDDVHGLGVSDLCTVNSEISSHTDIEHV
jgi:glutamate synthase domain-containing protein 2/rubredoxin